MFVHLGIYMYGNKRLTFSSDVNVLFIIIIACTFFYCMFHIEFISHDRYCTICIVLL